MKLFIAGLLVGLFVGGFIGVVVMCCCAVAHKADEDANIHDS